MDMMDMRDQQGRPPYKDALQAIGRYFDQQLYRGIFVAEIDEGYIGKARSVYEEAELHAEGFTFPFDDVRALIASPAPAEQPPIDGPPHCPYGYGLFLQAVGALCDRHNVRHVSVLEVTNGFVLCYTLNAGSGQTPRRRRTDDHRPERRRFVLDRIAVEEMITKAGV